MSILKGIKTELHSLAQLYCTIWNIKSNRGPQFTPMGSPGSPEWSPCYTGEFLHIYFISGHDIAMLQTLFKYVEAGLPYAVQFKMVDRSIPSSIGDYDSPTKQILAKDLRYAITCAGNILL